MRSKHDASHVVAVKFMGLARAKDAHLDTAVYEREMRTLRRVRHPNIVVCYGMYQDGSGTRKDPLMFCVVMELAAGGSLDDVVAKGEPLVQGRIRKILTQLASALHHLHAECGTPIVHGDLKPHNICFPASALAEDAGDDADSHLGLKLIDFGAAARSAEPLGPEFNGTIVTMPPESFANDLYHTPADIWATSTLISRPKWT